MKRFGKSVLALLLVLILLLGAVPAGLAAEAGNTEMPAPAESAAGGEENEERIWQAIEAFEAMRLPEDPGREDYAALAEELMALVSSLPETEPGSVKAFGEGFFFDPRGGVPNGWFPQDRVWDAQLDPDAAWTGWTTDCEEDGAAALLEDAALLGADDTTTNRHVALLEPYYNISKSFSGYYRPLADNVAAYTGGKWSSTESYYHVVGTAVNIQVVADAIQRCGVVMIDSHGTTSMDTVDGVVVGTSYICLTTQDNLTDEDRAWDETGTYRHAYNTGSNRANVDGTAIANHMSGLNPNGLVWFGECTTMMTDGLASPMRERGAEVVFGYSQNVTFSGDRAYAESFFGALCEGKTVAAAAYRMKIENGYWDHFDADDREKAGTYSYYSEHRYNKAWKIFLKVLYAFKGKILSTASDYAEATRDYEAQLERGATYTYTNNSTQRPSAFPIFVSEADPHPGFQNSEADRLQDVYSDWRLPKKSEKLGSYSYDVSHDSMEVVQGTTLNFPCVTNKKPTDTSYLIDAVALVGGSLPEGLSWVNQGKLQLPRLFGTPRQSGLFEPEFAIRYRQIGTGNVKLIYHTFHLMVTDPQTLSGEMTATVTMGGANNQWIYFQDARPEGDSYYRVERTYGSVPSGMMFLCGEVDHPRYMGKPTAAGTYYATYRIVYYSGKVCYYKVTVVVAKEDPISARDFTVKMTGNTLEKLELRLIDRKTGVDYADRVFEIHVLPSSRLPSGIKLIYNRSDEKPYLSGKLTSEEYGTQTTMVDALLTDGTVVCMDIQFDLPYLVHFSMNGNGLFDPYNSRDQWVSEGETASVPKDPVSLGDTFTGWYTEAECENLYDFDTPVTSDLTLYAGWETPTYVYYYGYENAGGGWVPFVQTYAQDYTLEEPEEPEREGYTFDGWYESIQALNLLERFNGFGRNISELPKKTLTLYPRFTPILTGLEIVGGGRTVAPGASVELQLRVEPWNAQPSVIWTSFDEALATVDENGVVSVSPDAPEQTAFTIVASAGGCRASVNFTVLTAYELWIGAGEEDETQVTKENASDVLGDGRISFDGDHTLTIRGGTFQNLRVNSDIPGLVIRLDGDVVVECDSWTEQVLNLTGDTVLTGGSLTVLGEDEEHAPYQAVCVEGAATLRLEDVRVSLTGFHRALVAYGKNTLELYGASLTARCLEEPGEPTPVAVQEPPAAISGFLDYDIRYSDLVEPEGGCLSPDGVLTAEGEVARYVRYAAQPRSTVSFTVTAVCDEPLVNVPVLVGDQVVYTDAEGNCTATVYGIAEEPQTIVISSPIDCVQTVTVTLPEPDPEDPEAPLTVELAPAATVTVSFDPGEGFGEMEPLEVAPGLPVELPDCAFTAPDGNSVFEAWDLGYPGASFAPEADTVVTALWRTLEHKPVRIEGTEPGCTTEGSLAAWYCPDCGRYFLDEECTFALENVTDASELGLPALGHQWTLSGWTWDEDNSWAVAEFVCAVCGSSTEVQAEIAYATIEPEGSQDGFETACATAIGPDGEEYTDTASLRIPCGVPQEIMLDDEGHSISWVLNVEENSLTVSGDLGGMPVTVSACDRTGVYLGEPLSITETGIPVSPVIPAGAAALVIEWNGQSETVELTAFIPLPGDLNGDGYDTQDVLNLLYCALIGEPDFPLDWPEEDCDFDGSGVFDADDALWLLFHEVEFEGAAELDRFVVAAYENGQMTELLLFDADSAFTPEAAELLKTAMDLRFFFLGAGGVPIDGMLERDLNET